MNQIAGVSTAKKKDGTVYYRSSITLHSRHVSLGSFSTPEEAGQAYREACDIVREGLYVLEDYSSHSFCLDFSKFVILLNYRNTGIYFKNPIYLQAGHFLYYLSPDQYLIFDREDLFFYATHKLQVRGGYYFICDYGSQYNILSRYGIKNHARKGIDYMFVNQNEWDFRYENIRVINEYNGVSEKQDPNHTYYECVIHVNGNLIVGRYPDKTQAAIAYNKAADILNARGFARQYVRNYLTHLSSEEYHRIYDRLRISKRITDYSPQP